MSVDVLRVYVYIEVNTHLVNSINTEFLYQILQLMLGQTLK